MTKPKFSHWVRWSNRDNLSGLNNPGVYALAITAKDISNTKFDWVEEIIYFGMTNSGGGLKARLKQFDNTIFGKEGHGGGERVRFKYREYNELINHLFVSVCPIQCDVKSNKPEDLLRMGEVTYLEYYCFSKYSDSFGRLPEFNDKKNSPKLTADHIRTANQRIQADAGLLQKKWTREPN